MRVSSPPPTDNVIPLEGGEYSVRLTGNWTGSVSVRMSVGGNIGGLLHAVCSNGAATVTFTVPANTNSSRTVTFEYLWNGTWIKIGNACTQQGYNVTAATHNAPATIPGLGGSYNVTLTGYLPSAGIEVRASSGGTALVTGKVTASGTAVSLRVPANLSYNTRTVTFEYLWNGTWTKIGNDCTQQGWHVTKASVSPAGDIPGAGGTYTVTLTGWGGYQVRAMSGSTELVIKTDFTEVANYSATIKIPAHTSLPTKRSVTFQYRFNGTWTDIETRTQYADLSNGVYFRNCENFCSHRGGLPTIDELRSYLWDGWPTTLQPDNTPLYYWSKYSGNAAVHVYAPATNVTSTLLYANEQNHAMCRCRDE